MDPVRMANGKGREIEADPDDVELLESQGFSVIDAPEIVDEGDTNDEGDE